MDTVTEDSWKLLVTRAKVAPTADVDQAIRIYNANSLVDDHNHRRLWNLKRPVIDIHAYYTGSRERHRLMLL
jgi:hypothetical protein